MYTIGFVRQEAMTVKEGEEERLVKWLECYIMVPGYERFLAKMVQNKNKSSEKEPDFYLYRRGKFNKNISFRELKIGALWLKEKTVDGKVEKYLTGSMLIGTQEVRIGVFRAKPLYEGEKLNHIYDIIMFVGDDERDKTTNTETYKEYTEETPTYSYEPTSTQAFDVDEEDIPF